MTSNTVKAVDPFISLAHSLDDFEQVLQVFPFVDAEERQNAISVYKNTSKGSLEVFLQSLGQHLGIRTEGISRLAGFFDLLQPWAAQSGAANLNGNPSNCLGILHATLIAGHCICGDLAIVTAKFDHMSDYTWMIRGDDLSIPPVEVVQGLLARLAFVVVQSCSNILRLRSGSEIQAYEPDSYKIDQVCQNFEKEIEKARKEAGQRKRADEQKRAADEEKIQRCQKWIEDMVEGDMQDKHDSIASSRVAGTGAAFVHKVQEWLTAKKAPTFLAHGLPGIGKTYLACAVISQHFEQPLEGVKGMAYTYFTYDDRDRQTPFVVYAGIVSQLLRDSSKLQEAIFGLFEEQRKLARKQKWQILNGFRRAVATLNSSKLLVFDALDEASEETREQILNLLEGARSDSPRILVTSRSDYRESLPHEQVLRYRVRADEDDIRAFSEDRLKNRNVKRIVKAKYGTGVEAQRFASSVSEEILINSQGLFLHAYYAAKDVCEQVNISGIRKAASKQHKDANVIYTIALEQIDGLAATKRDLAHRTIAWLTFAKEPFEEKTFKEAFAVDNRSGRVKPAAQVDVENVIEYCRGLVVRVKTPKRSYLRLAHMTAQEYFAQVDFFQQYHVDICLTCFNRVLSCLPPTRIVNQVHRNPEYRRGENNEEFVDLDYVSDEYVLSSSSNEASEESSGLSAEEGDDKEPSEHDDGEDNDDEIGEWLFESSGSRTMSEDYQSWRLGEDVWPRTLVPWVAKKTPFSLYAGRYALSHLRNSVVTSDLEKTVLDFVTSAISRRRRSTFSSKLQDHPYRMNMLHMASFIGIPSTVEEVLRMPTIHVDDRDYLGRTALMWALGLGKENVAERLLEWGAQIHEYDRRQRSTLMYASAVKNEVLLTLLLERAPEKDIDASFLGSCAKASNVHLIDRALSRANININHVNENGRTPIHEAVISGSEAAVHSLIRYGAKISISDSRGRTPLMYAAEGQSGDIVDILIRAGASPDSHGENNETPLHIAVKNTKGGGPRILQILFRANADILAEDKDGLVPLQAFLRFHRDYHWPEKETLACVKLLSGNPNTISHQSHDGANALHDAVHCPYIAILSYLVSQAPPNAINSRKDEGETPIFEALIAYNVSAFDLLIDLPGTDLLATRRDKKNLLNCAAWADKITVAQKLIDKEPRLIKLAEQHSVSAIHYAVERDNSQMFELLLEAGSDPRSRRQRFNSDLISYAAFEGRLWCLDKLLKLRAWMSCDQLGQFVAHKDDLGKTLLHEAAASGSAAVLRKILSSLPLEGLSLEDRDTLGQTPLHYAVRARKETLVSLLLTAGSNKDALTFTGATPLDLALDFQGSDTVRILVLADAHVGQASRSKRAQIQYYQKEDFFVKLNDIIAVSTGIQKNDMATDVRSRKEKIAHRIGTGDDIFDQWSPNMPFLEITVPESARLPITQVTFETVSHDQGWSSDAHQWQGTYDHSHTYFDVAVENVWEKNGDTEQKRNPRIRVQTNIHADFNFRRHINTFDCEELNQERREWVKALRPGDRIQLYAIAMYAGWQNFVQEARITIHYHELTLGKEIGDGSTMGLPEKLRKLKLVEQKPQEPSLSHHPKVVIYHQSLHTKSGILTSLRPLVREKTGVTAVILGNFHVQLEHKETRMPAQQHGSNGSAVMYLNEYTIDDPNIDDLWIDIDHLQREDVKIIGMLSMRGNQNESNDDRTWLASWDDSTFERSYKVVHDLILSRKFDGINLDVDVPGNRVNTEIASASIEGVTQLIDSLHADFGFDFIIAITASAESLLGIDTNQRSNGIDYQMLELQRGHLISWYNVQIFSSCGREDDQLGETRDPAPILVHELNLYIRLIRHDVYRAHKILVALSTTPNAVSESLGNRGAYVNLDLLHSLLKLLRWSYGPLDFGGVVGWEYSQGSALTTAASSRGTGMPWDWIKETKAILESVFPGQG